jgi:hypothetical protein
LPKTRTNQEDEFYSELDHDKSKQSSCSCYTLAVFFILLFCFLAALLIHFLRGFEFNKVDTSSLSQQSVSFAQADFTKKEPTIGLPITSADLTLIMKAGLQGAGARISEPQVEINSSAITLAGKTKMILDVSSQMEIVPTVLDDRLYLKIIKFQSWRLGLPGFVRGSLESSLNKLMDENLRSFYDSYKATDVQLTDSKMIIYGKLK